MTSHRSFSKKLLEPAKKILRPMKTRLMLQHNDKQKSELSYWKKRHAAEHGRFVNEHYRRTMLAMAEEADDTFLNNKVVADFGCGPRGSLAWARSAAWRIGIDVLADVYADEFTNDLLAHEMVYLKSTERTIPLPSNSIDVLFTLNALDHVERLSTMCDEMLRVIKPGGSFIGGFALNELPTPCEPQQLTEEIIQRELLDKLVVQSYRVARKGPSDNVYGAFFDGTLGYEPGQIGLLWVQARKNSSAH